MREIEVTCEEILVGYDALVDIYGFVPPLIMWRAWELAVYRHCALNGPVLDLGCGDGRFFRRAWGDGLDVVGLDSEAAVVDAARASGLYRDVHHASADAMPLADGSVATVFANCSIEHMDRLPAVLAEVARVLEPGGMLLMSVVTDKFVGWGPLRALATVCADADAGTRAQVAHERYHHLVNAFSRDGWAEHLTKAGLATDAWAPLMRGAAGWTFVLFDQLWHTPTASGEFGERMDAQFRTMPDFAQGARRIFEGLLLLADRQDDYAGLVLQARKP